MVSRMCASPQVVEWDVPCCNGNADEDERQYDYGGSCESRPHRSQSILNILVIILYKQRNTTREDEDKMVTVASAGPRTHESEE